MDYEHLYKKYKSKYLFLKNNMFGGAVIPGCCINDCGRMINLNANPGTTTCCSACKGASGSHTTNCNQRHNICNKCNVRYAACSGSITQFPTCCNMCPSGHTSICVNRNSQVSLSMPHIVVGSPWGANSAHVVVNGFPFAQTNKPPHVDFGGQFPLPGTIYRVGTLQQIVGKHGTAYVRYLLDNSGNKISHPKQGKSNLHITVYFQQNGTPLPSQLQPPP